MSDHHELSPLPPLPARRNDGHKGTFGTVAVVGGCADPLSPMIGAPALAALGALRAGCGRVRLVMPQSLLLAALTIVPSATGVALRADDSGWIDDRHAAETIDVLTGGAGHAPTCDVLVVGCGLGSAGGAAEVVERCLAQRRVPVVLDADGLNLLARTARPHALASRTVLTPHPGEFNRLARWAGLPEVRPDTTIESRRSAAQELARRLDAIVVLKDSGTIIADADRSATELRAVPALATAGTGDVLAGVIAGLIAQHAPRLPDLSMFFDLARAAVRAHKAAAVRWSRGVANGGMLACELTQMIPGEIARLRRDAPEPGEPDDSSED